MAFPSSTVSVPTLSSFQFSFRGVTMGPGTAYEFTKIEGVRDMPQVRSGDAGRPRDHGDFIGLDVLPGREINLSMEIGPPFTTTFTAALLTLATAMVPSATTEYPLFYCENSVTYACMARARRKSIPIDLAYANGSLAQNVVLQFKATDPRWYATPTLAPSCGLPTPVGGFAFPLAFPLSFGSGSLTNTISIANTTSDIDTRPILTVTGPCITPAIYNTSVTGTPSVAFGVTMATGDQLVIDMDFHTAVYYPNGSTVGYSVLSTLQTNSTWWTLPAATTSLILFSSADTSPAAGTLAVQWASASIL